MALNKNIMDSFLGGTAEEEKKKAAPARLGYYKRFLESGELLPNVRFTQGNRQEGLWLLDGDVKVFLPIDELYSKDRFVGHYVYLDHFHREYVVKVIAIDAEEKLVTVSVIKAQEDARPDVLASIDKDLKAGVHPHVKAIVEFIPRDNVTYMSKMAYLNILGLGIQGVLRHKDYADAFVPDLAPILSIGDVVDVAITGKSSSYKGQVRYECSRKEVIPSLWDHIGDYIKENDMVTVQCLSKMGMNFVGRIIGLPDITCSCVYPSGLFIETGGTYDGFVTEINPEKHHLFVNIGKAANSNNG